MATWQLGGLPNMGPDNQNAPGSAVPAPVQYQPRENLGVELANTFNQVGGALQQHQQQQAFQDFRQKFGAAYAENNAGAMRQLAAQHPEQMQQIQQGLGFVDASKNKIIGNVAMDLRLASQQGPEAVQSALQKNAEALKYVGASPDALFSLYQQHPDQFGKISDLVHLHAVGPEEYFKVQDQQAGRDIDRGRLAETVRSNQAGEVIQRRGQDITMRGQNISAATARRGQDLASQRANVRGGGDSRTVQLADGRTVGVAGKVHGSGANAFYEGTDNDGNMVRVPASAIAAPATSASDAQNYAMKKDIDSIADAKDGQLGFMTGMTGGAGSPAFLAEQRSRIGSVEERNLYNASRRIQGRMQNQGIASARDMGASGINTVAEAKMYFQGMPQVDYSSPAAMKQSLRDIREYTNNYNQQYNVNVGSGGRATQSQPAQQSAGFSSLWGD